jgi:hypothetical protein
MRQSLTLFLEQILQSGFFVKKDTKVITHDMARLATGTLDQDGPAVVALLRHAVLRAMTARFASEGNAIGFFVLSSLFVLCFTFGVRLCLARGCRGERASGA